MKRIFFPAAMALVLSGSLAFAQQPEAAPQDNGQAPPAGAMYHHHRPNPHREAMMLTRRLNLTPDQTAKLEPIFADRDQKFAALQDNTALSPAERHQQMQAIHESTEQQLGTVLTPDQIAQMRSMRHGRHEQGDQPQPPAPTDL